MGRIGKILIVLCCTLLIAGLAEAKSYVNREHGFSIWLPDETEIFFDGFAENVWSMKAEYKGLNILVMAEHSANHYGRDFNNRDDANEIIELKRKTGEYFGSYVTGYLKNPTANHHYAITITDNRGKDHIYGELATTIHRNMILISAFGSKRYLPVVREILDSFRCDKE